MTASIVIYGPQGCGKTRNSAVLMTHFDLEAVYEADVPGLPSGALPDQGALILTSDSTRARAIAGTLGIAMWHFRDAMDDLTRPGRGRNPKHQPPQPQDVQIPGVTAKLSLYLPPANAPSILRSAADAIEDRAAQRDQSDGERSMARTVAAFNALGGPQLTEVQGWIFMGFLKAARATGGSHHLDDYTDGAAYFALAGEAAERGAAA